MMKGKVFGARRRLLQLVTRAEKLGIDLQKSSSATVLRHTCGIAYPTASISLLVLVLGLLTLVLTFTIGHRYLLFCPSYFPSNRTQELHIQTLSWRLPRDEGVEPTDPVHLNNGLSGSTEQSSGNSHLLTLDDCEDLETFYEKRGHGNV